MFNIQTIIVHLLKVYLIEYKEPTVVAYSTQFQSSVQDTIEVIPAIRQLTTFQQNFSSSRLRPVNLSTQIQLKTSLIEPTGYSELATTDAYIGELF